MSLTLSTTHSSVRARSSDSDGLVNRDNTILY